MWRKSPLFPFKSQLPRFSLNLNMGLFHTFGFHLCGWIRFVARLHDMWLKKVSSTYSNSSLANVNMPITMHAQVLNYMCTLVVHDLSKHMHIQVTVARSNRFSIWAIIQCSSICCPATLTGYLATVNWYVTSV